MSGGADRWSDLRPRLLSALVMAAVGAVAVWAGGAVFAALVIVATGAMFWELAGMTKGTGPDRSILLGGLAAVCLLGVVALPGLAKLALLVVPAAAGLALPRRDRAVFAGYGLVIMVTGFGLIALRNGFGIAMIVWLLAVVIASDVMGYFAGRILGGPKFWPKVSPKKTWSGTVAGWIGAALVGWGFYAAGLGGAALIWLSPVLAFAGQLGDIAESAIKRRAGVKDSSNLIPGHGGVMDRFDALAAVVVVAVILAHLMALPVGGP